MSTNGTVNASEGVTLPKWLAYLMAIVIVLAGATYLYKEVVKPAGQKTAEFAQTAAEATGNDRSEMLRCVANIDNVTVSTENLHFYPAKDEKEAYYCDVPVAVGDPDSGNIITYRLSFRKYEGAWMYSIDSETPGKLQ